VQTVTVITGVVVGLTFLFGFGNVLNLALRLGVPVWVAPLVAPAVDLSILGLLLGTRHLALTGASPEVLRPARRLLIFASVVTLALTVADPLVAGNYGKAAFDAVGPLLLIGWSEVGPGLLKALTAASQSAAATRDDLKPVRAACFDDPLGIRQAMPETSGDAMLDAVDKQTDRSASGLLDDDLLEQAKQEDARHWEAHRRPISAETLRRRLHIGAARSRLLVTTIRADWQGRSAQAGVAAQVRA
jgi:hypothetical protein